MRRKDLLEYGQVASALITKSTTPKPSAGSVSRDIIKIDHDGMLNYEGGPNPRNRRILGYAKTGDPFDPLSDHRLGVPLYFARRVRRSEYMVEKFVQAGCKGIELDFKYLYDVASWDLPILP